MCDVMGASYAFKYFYFFQIFITLLTTTLMRDIKNLILILCHTFYLGLPRNYQVIEMAEKAGFEPAEPF